MWTVSLLGTMMFWTTMPLSYGLLMETFPLEERRTSEQEKTANSED